MATATPIREAASNWKPAKCEVLVDELDTGTHANLSKGQIVNLYPPEAKKLASEGKVRVIESPLSNPQKSRREADLEARLSQLERSQTKPTKGASK